MRLFLAGVDSFLGKFITEKEVGKNELYLLESFYTVKNSHKYFPLLKDFLLDSGAFTFFGCKKDPSTINWDAYVDSYINYINKYDIKHFFELDVDALLGYDAVKDIRKKLEKGTGKRSIPVFHKTRGIDEYKKLCSDYGYIAIGCSGKHDSAWTRMYPEKLYQLVRYANDRGVKVHGLGFTSLKLLKKMPFYSVDSTSWLAGNKFGSIYKFNGETIDKVLKQPGQRLRNAHETARNNFLEWKKFQHYMDLNY